MCKMEPDIKHIASLPVKYLLPNDAATSPLKIVPKHVEMKILQHSQQEVTLK